jgi:UPF0755 protein
LSRGNRSRPAHERTAEQRLRDREERERRRLGSSKGDRDPQQPAPAPAPNEATSADPAPASSQPTSTDALPAPRDAPADVAPAPGSEQSPVPAEPLGAASDELATEPPSESEPPEFGELPPPQPPVAERQDEHQGPDEGLVEDEPAWAVPADLPSASGAPRQRSPRDQPLQQRSIPLASQHEAAGGASGPGGPGRGGRPRRGGSARRTTRARVGALLALAAAAALVWFLLSLFQPFAGAGGGSVIVEIPKGSSSSKIGSILARDGVVSSGFFFDLRALLAGKRGSLHSGRFQLTRNISYSAAIDALSKPPPHAIAVRVVIPEGFTRRQIADLVSEDSLSGSYLTASTRSPLLDPRRYGAPAGTPDLEGFLFPATYDLTAGVPAARLVAEQLDAFRRRFSSADVRRAHALHVTPYQLLTVASMIEREAQTAHDRPLIAAVIYNRLREGIPLGIDATIYYAVELQKGIATYTNELTQTQLRIDSPYNTRTHKGLPPTPISNPGQASIEAAAHPAHVSYLYYVAAADGCGEQAFSRTYAEFQRNAAAYQAAVKKNGGHPPTCKKK